MGPLKAAVPVRRLQPSDRQLRISAAEVYLRYAHVWVTPIIPCGATAGARRSSTLAQCLLHCAISGYCNASRFQSMSCLCARQQLAIFNVHAPVPSATRSQRHRRVSAFRAFVFQPIGLGQRGCWSAAGTVPLSLSHPEISFKGKEIKARTARVL